MADVSHPLILPECYRGSVSPRSASTPGPSAPDSPASSGGRFSASPSANPYYSPYHNPAAAMGLMGSFLSVGSYGPYAALAAAAMAGQLAAGPSVPFINRLTTTPTAIRPPTHQHHPVSRVLPFSVENILKPDFGRAVHPLTAAESQQHPVEVKPSALSVSNKEAIKRPASSAQLTTIPSPSNQKKIKTTAAPIPSLPKIKADPADGRTSSCTDTSDTGSNSGKDGEQSSSNASTELPTDPTKMTDPSKWPAWIFCTRYSDRPSSGKHSTYVYRILRNA